MRLIAPVFALALGACATGSTDPHGPKTVVADAQGGAVTVTHGNRLRLPLATDASGAYEWHRVEPQVLTIVSEGPPRPSGIDFTPVRSGEEKLVMEYRPLNGGPAQRTVSYVITVPNDSAFFFRTFSSALP
jgi:hypothetical protein